MIAAFTGGILCHFFSPSNNEDNFNCGNATCICSKKNHSIYLPVDHLNALFEPNTRDICSEMNRDQFWLWNYMQVIAGASMSHRHMRICSTAGGVCVAHIPSRQSRASMDLCTHEEKERLSVATEKPFSNSKFHEINCFV